MQPIEQEWGGKGEEKPPVRVGGRGLGTRRESDKAPWWGRKV